MAFANRDEWLRRYEALRGPVGRLAATAVLLWSFRQQVYGLPVGRVALTGVVDAALLVPLYYYPVRGRGEGNRGWVPAGVALGVAAAGAYLNLVLVPSRDPQIQFFPAIGLAGGLEFPAPFALGAGLLVTGLAVLAAWGSGLLVPALGMEILPLVAIFAATSLGRLRRELRRREGRYLRELEVAHGRLQDAHAELQAAAERAVTLAAVEERNRIAREMHDILGHTLTVPVVQLQAVKRLLPGRIPLAIAQLDTLEELSRQSLREVRQVVRTMAGGPQGEAGVTALQALVSEFAERTGIKGTFSVSSAAGLEAGLSSQLFRILQESLTNARRHGQPSYVAVQLTVARDKVVLSVENDGVLEGKVAGPEGDPVLAPGFGLRGMRERCARLGGTLHYAFVPGGRFRVEAVLPLAPRDPEEEASEGVAAR
ncbi:MAG: sensor histidine kinase [Peptococcaceae bacterium]|jgi:signal transduction histidine kinase|nr:sensor histidine kinase [Peptococcaceae bacterium]